MKRTFDIVVACDERLGIGLDNSLPWQLPGDLKHFRTITSAVVDSRHQNAVVMGRKTWQSIPAKFKPLSNRRNIVLSRDQYLQLPEGVLLSSGLEQALSATTLDIEKIFIIGGANLYEQAIKHPSCDLLYLTEIKKDFECDTYFPQFQSYFELIDRSESKNENGIEYCFTTYKHRV